MTIHHHPGDDLLLDLAAGRLPPEPALLAAVHAEMCPRCGQRLRALEAVGGVLLESLPPRTLRPDALARVLGAIDALPGDEGRRPGAATTPVAGGPDWPAGAAWPQALRGMAFSPWKWIAPGMRWSRPLLPPSGDVNVFLLRIGPGRSLPAHTHGGLEWTQVLHGAFHDGHALFGAGDFDAADDNVHHQPVVQGPGDCICLAAVDGRLRFDGMLARLAGSLVGM